MTAALLTEPNVQKLHSLMLLLEIMRDKVGLHPKLTPSTTTCNTIVN